MQYQVIPFTAKVKSSEGSQVAAKQLEDLINKHAADGWTYARMESLSTTVVTPGTPGDNGCMGIGATMSIPERRDLVELYVAVFQK